MPQGEPLVSISSTSAPLSTMGKKNRRNNARKVKQDLKAAGSLPPQSKPKVGLLVTDELEKALSRCRATVERIARDYRAKNRKFRWVLAPPLPCAAL